MSLKEITKQQEYDYMIKISEYSERKPVDRWFLNYCRKYRKLCERVKKEGK